MGESPESKLTLRQAVSGKWQMPLFVLSMILFGLVLWQLRPQHEEPTFNQQYEYLQALAEGNRYHDFYVCAEQLRALAGSEEQLGQVHALAARTRVRQLKQQHELGLDVGRRRSNRANYESIIQDYRQALHRNWIDPNSPECAEVYHDFGLAYWGLNDTEKAIIALNRAIEVGESFDPFLHRLLSRMYMAARPKGYLNKTLELLEDILSNELSEVDDKSWAFVRKAEVLIAQGKEKESLELLNNAGKSVRESSYADEMVLLRGRALRHAGDTDEADLVLRDLAGRVTDRGDLYAQIALELGKISYEQFRDHDARSYYKEVVTTQIGKDWYVAGKLGLAECAALQQRYDEAERLYQETVDLLKESVANRAVEFKDIGQSITVLANELGLLKRYGLAVRFLEIEQQIATRRDAESADRFARMHYRMAMQLLEQTESAQKSVYRSKPSEQESIWFQQQRQLITAHFERAAEGFLRVAEFAPGDDELYVDSLWYAATSYDKAGNSKKAVENWRIFVEQCEGNSLWPRGLFNFSQAYQASGDYEAAITNYRRLRGSNPNSPAAFDSIVPLARCYLAKEDPDKELAEQLLLSILNDRGLTPRASFFREGLFELGELYYNDQQYAKAITRLIEAIDRYPKEPGLGKYMFIAGDSYRKSGLNLDVTLEMLSKDPADTVSRDKTTNLRRQNIKKAQEYFGRAVDFYEQLPPERRDRLDDLYLRHSWMYQADCLFDLGLFKQAALLYEEVALRYQLTPTALTAFIQIVNCHVNLNNPLEAASANRRAIWQLTKMSDTALAEAAIPIVREQWEAWFDWTDKSGLW